MTRVLVIGAGGVFGSRLAKGLARDGFDVEIGLPIVGRMVRYRGWLERV